MRRARSEPLSDDRWEIGTSFDELKAYLRGAKIALQSKAPDLIREEFLRLMVNLLRDPWLSTSTIIPIDFLYPKVGVIHRKLSLFPPVLTRVNGCQDPRINGAIPLWRSTVAPLGTEGAVPCSIKC